MTAKLALNNPKVICIMGPTASGKTSLAIEAAKALNGEVVSVDSALIYKDMDIGTAKPKDAEKQGIPHHLIDLISPEISYSVADFITDAENAINDIVSRGKLPILAGGTMMYFNALINGLNEMPPANLLVRQKIQEMTSVEMHKKLIEVDPNSAKRIHSSDTQRLTRALEVFESSGKSLSDWQNQDKKCLPFDFEQFSIMPEQRSTLHKLIEQRFDLMLGEGLVAELEYLLDNYALQPDMPSMRSVGYRQVWQYLRGELDKNNMRERGIIATRQLAKRQVTWLRGWGNITSLFSADKNKLKLLIKKVGAT